MCHEEWVSVRSRLGLKGEEFSCPATFDPRGKGLAWAPPGLPAHKVGDRFSVRYRFNQPFVVSTNYRRVTAKFDDCREKLFGRLRQKDTIRSEIFLITRHYYTILVCGVVHSRLYIPIRTFGELPVSDIFQSTRHKLTRTGLYRRMLYRARFPCPLPTRIYHIFFLVFDARALFKERCIPNILARWRYT